LHRQLTALGVTNYVIRRLNWDDQHKRVKTNRTDALDRFVAGNPLTIILDEQSPRLLPRRHVRRGSCPWAPLHRFHPKPMKAA